MTQFRKHVFPRFSSDGLSLPGKNGIFRAYEKVRARGVMKSRTQSLGNWQITDRL